MKAIKAVALWGIKELDIEARPPKSQDPLKVLRAALHEEFGHVEDKPWFAFPTFSSFDDVITSSRQPRGDLHDVAWTLDRLSALSRRLPGWKFKVLASGERMVVVRDGSFTNDRFKTAKLLKWVASHPEPTTAETVELNCQFPIGTSAALPAAMQKALVDGAGPNCNPAWPVHVSLRERQLRATWQITAPQRGLLLLIIRNVAGQILMSNPQDSDFPWEGLVTFEPGNHRYSFSNHLELLALSTVLDAHAAPRFDAE
jgi:hypothetical protein